MIEQELLLLNLVRKAKEGDDKSFDKIIKILEHDLKKIASKFFIVGSDDQDVLQECKIGVWKAIKDFDESGGMSFKNFSLSLCCKRHLITAMSHANTLKYKLHNESVSLSSPTSQHVDDITLTYADVVEDPNSNLLDNYIEMEEFNENINLIKGKLTKLELSIFNQYAYNSSYKDIAEVLDVKPKTVDNALMRIRKKSAESYKIYNESQMVGFVTSSAECEIIYESRNYTQYIGFGTQSLL
jgi:RNA polymerase sporulation-specific sigma factor